MLHFKQYDENLKCIKNDIIEYNQLKSLYNNFNQRDIRIIKLDFEGDIAQIITKNDGFLIKLFPIACIYTSTEPRLLTVLNTNNFEVAEFCNLLSNSDNKLTIFNFIEMLLIFHSDKLDKKIKKISIDISKFTSDNIQTKQLGDIAKIFHDLLLLRNQYQEIQQTLTQINEFHNDKLKIVNEIGMVDEFGKIINIYQNQFEEDVKNLNRMAKEIEILIQMADIKFADKRNNIAITSLNLDVVILLVSLVSMFGSIFGMNLDSSLEDISFGLYFVLLGVGFIVFISYKIIRKVLDSQNL